MKNRIISLLLCAFMLALAGCNQKGTDMNETNATEENKVEEFTPDFEAGEAYLKEAEKLLASRKSEILKTESDYTLSEGGTVYYISTNGDDTNPGTSPDAPWKTVARMEAMQNNGNINKGDVVLFERGCEWRERWVAKEGVTYSAYGEGAKPIFNGNELGNAADPYRWQLVEGTENIWKYNAHVSDVGNIVYNDGEKTVTKLLPNIIDSKHYINNQPFDPVNSFAENDTFMCEYVNTGVVSVDVATPSRLYVRCDEGNPGEVYDSVEIVYRGNLINGASYATFDNLCIKYSGSHGIGMGTVYGVTVKNCEVGYIGGSAQYWHTNGYIVRFGNGIEIYGGCKDFVIDNCYVYECYDAGITHQISSGGSNPAIHKNVSFTNNVIEKCIYNIEYFMGASDGDLETRKMTNILYENNILAYSGEGWGMDPGRSASIKGWNHRNEAENFVIKNNLFISDKVNACDLGAYEEEWLPTFEANTYVQTYGHSFTKIGSPSAGQFYYNDKIPTYIEKIIGETGAKLYFVE